MTKKTTAAAFDASAMDERDLRSRRADLAIRLARSEEQHEELRQDAAHAKERAFKNAAAMLIAGETPPDVVAAARAAEEELERCKDEIHMLREAVTLIDRALARADVMSLRKRSAAVLPKFKAEVTAVYDQVDPIRGGVEKIQVLADELDAINGALEAHFPHLPAAERVRPISSDAIAAATDLGRVLLEIRGTHGLLVGWAAEVKEKGLVND